MRNERNLCSQPHDSLVSPPSTLTIFYQFCDNCKILSCTFYLKEDEMKIATFANFKEYHGNHKKIKSLHDFGFWILVSVQPKSIIPGKMTNLNMFFHVVMSVYRLVKIWNSPSSLMNFGTANCANSKDNHGSWKFIKNQCAINSHPSLLDSFVIKQHIPCFESLDRIYCTVTDMNNMTITTTKLIFDI